MYILALTLILSIGIMAAIVLLVGLFEKFLSFFKVRMVAEKKLEKMVILLERAGYTPDDLKTA